MMIAAVIIGFNLAWGSWKFVLKYGDSGSSHRSVCIAQNPLNKTSGYEPSQKIETEAGSI